MGAKSTDIDNLSGLKKYQWHLIRGYQLIFKYRWACWLIYLKLSTKALFWVHNYDTHGHFLCTIVGPFSSYSTFEIHISLKVESEDKIAPPMKAKYFLSGGDIILTVLSTNCLVFLDSFSGNPGNKVVPPLTKIFSYKCEWYSLPHFMIAWCKISWKPGISLAIILGLKRASGHLNLMSPTEIVWPSGS